MSSSSQAPRRQPNVSVLAGSAVSRLLMALPLGGLLWLAVVWAWGA